MKQSHRIAAQIADAHQIDQAKAEALVGYVFDAISRAVISGDQVIIPGIGLFRTIPVTPEHFHDRSTEVQVNTPNSTRLALERFN